MTMFRCLAIALVFHLGVAVMPPASGQSMTPTGYAYVGTDDEGTVYYTKVMKRKVKRVKTMFFYSTKAGEVFHNEFQYHCEKRTFRFKQANDEWSSWDEITVGSWGYSAYRIACLKDL